MCVTPQLISAASLGINLKLLLQPCLPDQILHDKLSHGGAADIAVANKKYLFHRNSPSRYAVKRRKMPVSAHPANCASELSESVQVA
jgi:hypothetical protein